MQFSLAKINGQGSNLSQELPGFSHVLRKPSRENPIEFRPYRHHKNHDFSHEKSHQKSWKSIEIHRHPLKIGSNPPTAPHSLVVKPAVSRNGFRCLQQLGGRHGAAAQRCRGRAVAGATPEAAQCCGDPGSGTRAMTWGLGFLPSGKHTESYWSKGFLHILTLATDVLFEQNVPSGKLT